MSVLCQRKNESTAIVRNRDISSNWGAGIETRRSITAPAMHLLDTLTRSRKEKVLLVRRQIAEGTYDLDKRLDAILDRLLEDLVA
jgi:anti-sigma28 factor (negative regulator of flagellin synthesis)